MGISTKVKTITFISVICLLVIALTASSAVIFMNDRKIKELAEENRELISEKGDKLSGLEEENKALAEENEKQKKQLEEAEKKNQQLESENKKYLDENNKLKSEIATLKAQKGKGDKVCYLTFDDGPSKNTLEILKILKKYNVKATFFVINTSDIAYVKNIKAEGHTIGLHSSSHLYNNIYSSTDAYFADLKAISDKVEALTGTKSTITRFPGGSSNLISKKYCPGIMSNLVKQVPERGYSYFDWNVDSGDADKALPSYTYILNKTLKGAEGKSSICVLMHDAAGKTTTVQALPHIIEGLASRGYRFQALTTATMAPGFRHQILYN